MKTNNTWNIILLVDETIIPANQQPSSMLQSVFEKWISLSFIKSIKISHQINTKELSNIDMFSFSHFLYQIYVIKHNLW